MTHISIGYMLFSVITIVMFAILPDIRSAKSRKVVLYACGRKIKNSWLNPFFFNQSSKLHYWIHQFDILLRILCFVSLLPVAFYSWPQVFHTDPELLYPIHPRIFLLIA